MAKSTFDPKVVTASAAGDFDRSVEASQAAMVAANKNQCQTALMKLDRAAAHFGKGAAKEDTLGRVSADQLAAADDRAAARTMFSRNCIPSEKLSGLGSRRRRKSHR